MTREDWDCYWKQGQTRIGKRLLDDARKKAIGMMNKLSIHNHIIDVLDVGCGSGDTMMALQDSMYIVTGMDISEQAVKLCKARGFSRVHQGSAEKMPFKKNEFDLVFSEGLLEHFSFMRLRIAARGMAKVSKRYIMLIQPNHFSLMHKLQGIYYGLGGGKDHVKEYSYKIEDFDRVMGMSGFKRMAMDNTSMFWILLYQKVNA